MRHAAKRDAIEAEIVETLRRVGYVVSLVSSDAIPDLIIRKYGAVFLCEVKDPKHGKLTKAQEDWWNEDPDNEHCFIAHSPLEALQELDWILWAYHRYADARTREEIARLAEETGEGVPPPPKAA